MTASLSLPASTAAPLRGGPVLRWGVLGPGEIASAFTKALHDHTDQRVVAVGSRSEERSAPFAADHGVERSHASYKNLLSDPSVDIVYIATPNNVHRDHALAAIAAGKHVLVEKPIAMDAAQAREIAMAARDAGVFAMEAMWTRFQPKSTVIARLLDDGALGNVTFASATLGSRFPQHVERIWDPRLGGGSLLDLGTYSVWWTQFALGTPTAVSAVGSLGATGVDVQAVISLTYPGAQGVSVSGALATLDNTGVIAGTEGLLTSAHFLAPGGFVLSTGGRTLEYEDPSGLVWRDGLCWQAAAIAGHIADGRTEAPEHPLAASIAVMETLDAARAALGYAF
ncbi:MULTISPECIES: Gfo/Idh/MocA family protein [unclassified Microbacterium]|uniref:Gfo/Idh/MocA family protein n=1 Tax=unclassified Microbacterium TaxID=2609290 RepID=UPI00342E40DB